MKCSVSVYDPRTSRRPKPNSRRSQDRTVLCSVYDPRTSRRPQAEQSPVRRPCRALFPSTSRERHVGPSRIVTGPKTMPCSVPSTSGRRHVGPSRTVTGPKTSRALFRRRPENVTSAQAEQAPFPRPCRALFRLRPENVPPAQPNLSRSKGPSVLCVHLHPASVASAQPNRRRPRKNVTPAPAEQARQLLHALTARPKPIALAPSPPPHRVNLWSPRTNVRPTAEPQPDV